MTYWEDYNPYKNRIKNEERQVLILKTERQGYIPKLLLLIFSLETVQELKGTRKKYFLSFSVTAFFWQKPNMVKIDYELYRFIALRENKFKN